MSRERKIKIFLVDDDALFMKALEIDFIEQANFIILPFSSGELCVDNLYQKPDVIILDYHLDGINPNAMNGIETLDRIRAKNQDIPVIILSGQDKIEVAIDCMHHKAYDYVVKSETAAIRIQKIIAGIFHFQKMEMQLNWYKERM